MVELSDDAAKIIAQQIAKTQFVVLRRAIEIGLKHLDDETKQDIFQEIFDFIKERVKY